MGNNNKYGSHRCIEPRNSFPNQAWKLDNSCEICDDEALLEVTLLNIDSNSFKQIYVECDENISNIKNKIFDIVRNRGKLHNPITNTGGILLGQIINMGRSFMSEHDLSIGDRIISLSSLTLTPLNIEEISEIDINSGQAIIKGKAILFSHSPYIKIPSDLPINLMLSVLDEAGAAMQCFNLAKKNTNILVIGASGKIGLMCAFAMRKKIGTSGRIIGVRSPSGDSSFRSDLSEIYDEVYYTDILKPIEALKNIKEAENSFDLVINCINVVGTEMFSILSTKDEGSLYLASLGNNYKSLCSSAEGLAKDINIIAYKGFSKNHANFTIELLREYPLLIEQLNKCLKNNLPRDPQGNKLNKAKNLEKNLMSDINFEEYVFSSPEIQDTLDNALKVANYDCTVLLTGESGTGKEVFAKLIHKCSDRNHLPLIKINCGSIPKNLLESELFGYEKGSFTGADKNGKLGFFEAANGGTLFLDEIGELPVDLQVKLLRAIQEKEIYRIGALTQIKVDVRILAATNKNLLELVREGKFREDLYYRLNVFPIEIPPLRERKSDIIPLVKSFTEYYNEKFKLNKIFNQEALNYIMDLSFPGNIRELENLVQRLLISVEHNVITVSDIARNRMTYDTGSIELKSNVEMSTSLQESLDNREYEILKKAKEKYKTTRSIAKALGLSQSTLVRKLRKFDL